MSNQRPPQARVGIHAPLGFATLLGSLVFIASVFPSGIDWPHADLPSDKLTTLFPIDPSVWLASSRLSTIQDVLDQGRKGPGGGDARSNASRNGLTRVLVRFQGGVGRGAARRAVHGSARGGRVLREYGGAALEGLCLVEVTRGERDAALAAYRAAPEVLYAEPDYKLRLAVSDDNLALLRQKMARSTASAALAAGFAAPPPRNEIPVPRTAPGHGPSGLPALADRMPLAPQTAEDAERATSGVGGAAAERRAYDVALQDEEASTRAASARSALARAASAPSASTRAASAPSASTRAASAPSARIPNDPDFALQWGLLNIGQPILGDPGVPGADLRATYAWDLWTGNPDERIALLDTGVDYDHPDLAANCWTNPGEIPGNGVDDDANGWVDDVHGYDTVNEDGDPRDDVGHGTHVAGILGALGNNGVGVAGVNWKCRIVALKIFDADGDGFVSDAVEALNYVIANHIPLSNNSWGGDGPSQALRDAIAATQTVDHLFVAAAGNAFGRNIDDFPVYPASYDLPHILSVTGTGNDDLLSFVANIGSRSVDVGAPGHFIYSTLPGGGYGYLTGTSMATGYATGVAALLRSRLPQLSALEVKARLLRTTRPLATLAGRTVSGGILDAAAAVGDCNHNAAADEQDIASGASADCDLSGIPDECERDCNANGVSDVCDAAGHDCNHNGVPDGCDLAGGADDCNANGVLDACDVAAGGDVNADGVPDECQRCVIDADCTDDNACTNDACVSGLCAATLGAGPCDDDDDCTENDLCVGEVCTGTVIETVDCAPILSLKAARINGVPVPGGSADGGLADVVSAQRGDRVTVEFYLERWSPRILTGYNVLVDDRTYRSGSTGSLMPLRLPTPSAGAFIDDSRPDYILRDRPKIALVWNDELDFYQYGGIVLFNEDCAEDSDVPAYLGTLVLDVSDTASGDFTVCFKPGPSCFLLDCPVVNQVLQFDFQCVTIRVPLGDCARGPDCNANGRWDICDIHDGVSPDCNRNDIPDECDFASGTSFDCNANTLPDECDLAAETSPDCDQNHIPDECQADCNANAVADACDIAAGASKDCNSNMIPDECDLSSGAGHDCDGYANGVLDECEADCNGNAVADTCDLAMGTSVDDDENGIPDECQTVREVPSAYATLQLAVDAADPGDVILVADGTYGGEGNVQLDFGGKPLTLRSRSGPANCAIDITDYRHGILFHDGEDLRTRVDGFTFQGGFIGIQFENGSAPLISNCRFTHLRSAALLCYSSSPRIHHCAISVNSGGKMIYCWVGSDPLITHCTITNNRGGALFSYESDPVLSNCLIADNRTFTQPVIHLTRSSPTFRHCTIVNNFSLAGAIFGNGSDVTLSGNIFRGNQFKHTPQIVLLDDSHATVTHNDLEEGRAAFYVDADSSISWGEGNMNVDPQFVRGDGVPGFGDGVVSGDYHLLPTSPCINTGGVASTGEVGKTDLDGESRVQFSVVDIGADEATMFFDCNGNSIPDGEDVQSAGSLDCNETIVPDECELFDGRSTDCNQNSVPDECDLASGFSTDCNHSGILDACEPDADVDGVIDDCDLCPLDRRKSAPGVCGCGALDKDADGDGVPNCLDRCPGWNDDLDCNGNGVPDGCDVALAAGVEVNMDAATNGCAMPEVEAGGERYLVVRSAPGTQPVAFQVRGDASDPLVSCVQAYVQANGILDDPPFFQSGNDWGVFDVTGAAIRPDATYAVIAEYGSSQVISSTPPVRVRTPRWGDVDRNGLTNLADVQMLVNAYAGAPLDRAPENYDLAPCRPDGLIDFTDVNQAVRAFRGESYEETSCLPPCR